jgi:hypothetical protein
MKLSSCKCLSRQWSAIPVVLIALMILPIKPLAAADASVTSVKESGGDKYAPPVAGGFNVPTLEGPWRFRIAVDGFMPTDIKLTVRTPAAHGSETKDLNWLVDNLDYVIPIDAEVRKGSFGAFAHLFAFKLTGDMDAGPAHLDWDDEGFLLDVGISYELGRWPLGAGERFPSVTVEPFFGARLFHDPVDVDIDIGDAGGTKEVDLSVYVPIVGLRTYWDLTKNWDVHLEGDYGGFDVDDGQETWNAIGLVGYRIRHPSHNWHIQAGYRALRLFDLKKSKGDIRGDLSGPIIVISSEF